MLNKSYNIEHVKYIVFPLTKSNFNKSQDNTISRSLYMSDLIMLSDNWNFTLTLWWLPIQLFSSIFTHTTKEQGIWHLKPWINHIRADNTVGDFLHIIIEQLQVEVRMVTPLFFLDYTIYSLPPTSGWIIYFCESFCQTMMYFSTHKNLWGLNGRGEIWFLKWNVNLDTYIGGETCCD